MFTGILNVRNCNLNKMNSKTDDIFNICISIEMFSYYCLLSWVKNESFNFTFIDLHKTENNFQFCNHTKCKILPLVIIGIISIIGILLSDLLKLLYLMTKLCNICNIRNI